MKEFKPTLPLLLVVGLMAGLGAADSNIELGSFLVQAFGPRTYGAHPQNWAAVQNRQGVMFFGNSDGIVEYDGVVWRHLVLPGNTGVRALALDSNGRVLVGGQGEFGYLDRDEHGQLRYFSLLSRLNPEDRKFGDIWSILPTQQGVYFSSYQRLFRLHPDGSVKVWRPRTRFSRAFLVDGAVMVTDAATGLQKLVNDTFQLMPGGEAFQSVLLALFRSGDHIFAVSREGIFRNRSAKFERFATEADDLLAKNVYSALPLPDGTLLIGTVRSGVVMLDGSGKLIARIGKEEGLPSDYVVSMYRDRQGGIWVMTINGLARFELTATIFDEKRGLRGGGTAVARHDGVLYAGTQTGLYRLQPQTGQGETGGAFVPVPEVQGTILVLQSSPRGLLVGGQSGLYLIHGRNAQRIYATDVVFDLAFSRSDPDVLYVAGRAGFTRLRNTRNGWAKDIAIPGNGQEFRSLLEGSDGRIWIAARADVLRLDLGASPAKVDRFTAAEGVPAGWKSWYAGHRHPVLVTEKGLRKFVNGKFVSDDVFGNDFAVRPVIYLRSDARGNVWVSGKDYHGVLTKQRDDRWKLCFMPLLSTRLVEIWALHSDANGVVWAAGPEGWLARYEPVDVNSAGLPLSITLRVGQSTSARQSSLQQSRGPTGRPQMAEKDADLRFEFAAPLFEPEPHTEYRVFLEGLDADWSVWSGETRKDYTHLPAGRYLFKVNARHPHGEGVAATEFPFRVIPPGYKTWWAYALYGIAAAAAIWQLVRWRVRKLKQRNHHLEEIIEQRTARIRQQRDLLQEAEKKTEALLLNILPRTVADELRSAGAVQPKLLNDVTVCFTDFVAFTLTGERVRPETVVQALHEYFTAFDAIIDRYKLEKLKTIGDAYMFAGGVPEPRESHGVDCVLAALDICSLVQQFRGDREGISWSIRIGLHSGPVVAGVVGRRKFAFDIWGDTVNLAARLESSGSPDRVNISPSVYEAVKDLILCEPRGVVTTKEGRQLEMYFACEVIDADKGEMGRFASLYRAKFGHLPPIAADKLQEVGT
jgi:class 3 adenylate cyclase/ligand-binding sensor domain-containing protein